MIIEDASVDGESFEIARSMAWQVRMVCAHIRSVYFAGLQLRLRLKINTAQRLHIALSK